MLDEYKIYKVGKHVLMLGDFTIAVPRILKFYDVDMVYVDPPWNLGNLNMFLRKAGKAKEISFEDFLNKLVNTMALIGKVQYVEMGYQYGNKFASMVSEVGGKITNVWRITYYGNRPCLLYRVVFGGGGATANINLDGIDDKYTPRYAMEYEKPKTVMDFCLGEKFTTLRTADALGIKCIGVEINKKKLEKAFNWLIDKGYSVEVIE